MPRARSQSIWRLRRRAGRPEVAHHRGGVHRRRPADGHGRPGHLDAGADAARSRQRGAEEDIDRPDPARRDHLVPGLFRAGRGLGPRVADHARVEDGDDFVINGQKIWTSTAAQADMIFCLVRTEPDKPKHEGISYLLFSMKTPGIEVRPLVTMTGPRRVQRGVLHRRARAEDRRRRRARPGLVRRQRDAEARARHAGRSQPGRHAAQSADRADAERGRRRPPPDGQSGVARPAAETAGARACDGISRPAPADRGPEGRRPRRGAADREADGLRAQPPARRRSRSTRWASSACSIPARRICAPAATGRRATCSTSA